jgi:hypothetical protein
MKTSKQKSNKVNPFARNAEHYNALHQSGAGFHSDKRERRESGKNRTREYREDYELSNQIREEVSYLE